MYVPSAMDWREDIRTLNFQVYAALKWSMIFKLIDSDFYTEV